MPYKDRRLRAEAVYRWRKRHPEKARAIYRRSNQQSYAKKRALLVELKSVPCMDCGQRYPHYVMDFDHREPDKKVMAVGHFMAGSWGVESMLKEIAKCDVVCSNCHRIRTYKDTNMTTNSATEEVA